MFHAPVRSKAANLPLSSNLFIQLRADILQGKLKPGTKLTEQCVCNEYAVSRTPVREAFRQLELDGLMETIPNRGAFILGVTQQDIEDMYILRQAYESIAVQWAIQRITAPELDKLKEAYDLMEFYTSKGDAEKMLSMNMHFHELIYDAAHNKMLKHTLSSYQFYTKQTKVNQAYVDDYLEEVLHEHHAIFQAFLEHDPRKGTDAIVHHLENARKRAGLHVQTTLPV